MGTVERVSPVSSTGKEVVAAADRGGVAGARSVDGGLFGQRAIAVFISADVTGSWIWTAVVGSAALKAHVSAQEV